jgi:rubrerythrin
MPEQKSSQGEQKISRDQLAKLLNEDLSREYQAIISYVVYSQVLKGAEYMSIADQLELHAQQELKHALIISRQIDYLAKCRPSPPSQSRLRKRQRKCSALIWKMRMKRSGITARGFGNVKPSANLPWRSRFGRFS